MRARPGHVDATTNEPACVKDPNRPIQIIGSEGNDAISILGASHVPDSIPITIDGRGGGPGDDTITGGPGKDTIMGDSSSS